MSEIHEATRRFLAGEPIRVLPGAKPVRHVADGRWYIATDCGPIECPEPPSYMPMPRPPGFDLDSKPRQ